MSDRLCSFYGCDEPICEADKQLKNPGSLRFCQEHSDEINSYFKAQDGWRGQIDD